MKQIVRGEGCRADYGARWRIFEEVLMIIFRIEPVPPAESLKVAEREKVA